LIKELGLPVPSGAPTVYAIVPPEAPLAQVIAALEKLRAAGVSVLQHAGGADGRGSIKSQFKKADASGARFAMVFGTDELARGVVTVKNLREGVQQEWPLADLALAAGQGRRP
jgi:histidyl-tRNA synthetase